MAKRASGPAKLGRWMLATTAAVAACMIGLALAGSTGGSGWLPAAWADAPLRDVDQTAAAQKREPRPLPTADAKGVVNLPDAGPWQASLLESPGSVTIRGASSKPAVLILDEPLVVRAGQLHLENIVLKARSTDVILDCVCQRLRIQRARFEGHRTNACIRWDTPDPRDRSGRSLTITDTEFRGGHAGIEMRTPPADLNLGNVLFTRMHSGLRFTSPLPAGHHANIRMIRVTQRLVTNVLESALPDNGTIAGQVTLWLEDSVFALQGRHAAVFALTGAELPPPSSPIIETRSRRDADPSLLSVGSHVALWTNPQSGLAEEVPAGLLAVNDLTASPLTFKSVSPTVAVESELTGFEAPRRSTKNPGVDASTLLR